MLSASEIENCVVVPAVGAPIVPPIVETEGAEDPPGAIRPIVFPAPVESRFTANSLSIERSSSANTTWSTTCLSTPWESSERLFTTVLAKGADNAAARSAISLVATCPVNEIESCDP